jgi:hypothetical protein
LESAYRSLVVIVAPRHVIGMSSRWSVASIS